jgi:(R)-2-hydroxyacyl-CoA dehydratese activating ATPase
MICGGIDSGSRTIKGVLLDERSSVLASVLLDQGVAQAALARQLLDELLGQAGLAREQVARIVATGYGRENVDFADARVTEITCHAQGVRHHHSGTRTIIDIGGQDSKVIRLDDGGAIRDFVMNDRCAAGSGRFLEVVAGRLSVDPAALGRLAADSQRAASISSMCVVFAETEIIGLLAAGASPNEIAAGVLGSIAARIAAMAGRRKAAPVVFTGGVAKIPSMAQALERAFGLPVQVAREAQMTGAWGAALVAHQQLGRKVGQELGSTSLAELKRRLSDAGQPWGVVVIAAPQEASDEVLARVARFLRQQIRSEDVLLRTRRGEFLLGVVGAPAQVAAVARRIAAVPEQWSTAIAIGWAAVEPGDELEAIVERARSAVVHVPAGSTPS